MDWRLILGLTVVNLALTLGILIGGYVKFVRPQVEEFFKSVSDARNTTKSAMTALSGKASDVRQQKAMEGDLIQGILDANPELEIIASNVAPEFFEKMVENPRAALALLERYGPVLEKMGLMQGVQGEKAQSDYDVG